MYIYSPLAPFSSTSEFINISIVVGFSSKLSAGCTFGSYCIDSDNKCNVAGIRWFLFRSRAT